MPTGIYKRTEEQNKIRSERMKKNPLNYWLGKVKPHSEETKKKISQSLMGHLVSKKAREKIKEKSVFQKGYIPWNKGKAWPKEMSQRISLTSKAKGIEPKIKYIGKGKDSANWKGGKDICNICSKVLSTRQSKNKLCKKCYHDSTKGEKHYNWKGGITPKNKKIRNSIEYRLWRESVFARDNWTCQKTGIQGGLLHAHHINNFSEIIELRTSIGNGITLSKKSHKKFHEKYGKKDNTREQLLEFLENK